MCQLCCIFVGARKGDSFLTMLLQMFPRGKNYQESDVLAVPLSYMEQNKLIMTNVLLMAHKVGVSRRRGVDA